MRERRQLILKEVVDRYIKTRRPVSSKEIVEVYGHRWSSATIRNELAALEREGYLYKPSPSAGRIPTAKGFRYFARWLLELSELLKEQVTELAEPFGFVPQEVREVFRLGAHVLSTMTDQLSFVIPPPVEELRIRRAVLLPWGGSHALLYLHTELGLVGEYAVGLSQRYSPGDFAAAEGILTRLLRGRTLREVVLNRGQLTTWYERPERLVHELLGALRDGDRVVFFAGLDRLAIWQEGDFPRGEVLRLLNEPQRLAQLIVGVRGDAPGLAVHVGDIPSLPLASAVSTSFFRRLGVVGVLGPLWLDYARTISAVRYVGGRLSGYLEFLGRMSLSKEVIL